MRFRIRRQPTVKAVVYALFCFSLILFASSFLPALSGKVGTPYLLVGAVAALARFEDVRYASVFGLLFGTVEAVLFGESLLFVPLFYTAFALLCAFVFENWFAGNFFSWLLCDTVGILLHLLLLLFAIVSAWDISAADALCDPVLPDLIASFAFSVPLYPIFKRISSRIRRMEGGV